ncbi:hypothetical protein PLEOSDRAFT_1099777 [Pleurotus ostreatus PC15]|uniref:Transmembrane protein n=1 Tax=Pleurotus ostreatus (strain PC15) TaxID=1137138 RepID=A0A067PBR4_PLEO1|nr:hypothetical protein PLEOSDRAFT_1099777 [Pleurotus ostreatus PC15]
MLDRVKLLDTSESYINLPHRSSLPQQTFSHSPVPPITMRVALFVLAFAAVFVLASPNADKKKKVKKPTAAPADAAPPADAPPADDAAAA